MMKLTFDLISDLHVETWPLTFDWTGQSTSMVCVVAGDISRDRDLVKQTLEHLSTCYQAVFYIDGNDEHRWSFDNFDDSYSSLINSIEKIPNMVFLQDHVGVVDGVAFVGTNGWWGYDLNPDVDYDQTKLWFQDHYQINQQQVDNIEALAMQDFAYLTRSIQKLQTMPDVKQIVLVTHTVPRLELINHDPAIATTYRVNTSGNSAMQYVLENDTENKISTWCFGHYHGDVDQVIGDVRYVNNCRGRGNTPWSKSVYYPKRITVSV
jgi:predicted phosphodiesterase